MTTQTKPSEEERTLKPILALVYDATKKGWGKFTNDANIAHVAGYELMAVTALGQKSIGAVWKLTRESKHEYTDFLGTEESELSDDAMDSTRFFG